MAGPSKLRKNKEEKQQQKQQREEASSADNSSGSRPTQRSINKFDGNRDPDGHGVGVLEYTRPNDLKNLSEFLGFAGWCAARGVSANAPVPPSRVRMQADKQQPCFRLPRHHSLVLRDASAYYINTSTFPYISFSPSARSNPNF